jgi:hypothetical protein
MMSTKLRGTITGRARSAGPKTAPRSRPGRRSRLHADHKLQQQILIRLSLRPVPTDQVCESHPCVQSRMACSRSRAERFRFSVSSARKLSTWLIHDAWLASTKRTRRDREQHFRARTRVNRFGARITFRSHNQESRTRIGSNDECRHGSSFGSSWTHLPDGLAPGQTYLKFATQAAAGPNPRVMHH